jgi:hypothetical protein
MTRHFGPLVGAVMAVAATLSMVGLSRAPLSAYPDDTPVLRLAWSARPERIERCRTLTDAELADVPAHMRQRVQCEGRSASYRLSVSVDGRPALDTLVTGGGARSDRPVYVFRELDVPAGQHEVVVRFEREKISEAEAGGSVEGKNGGVAEDTLMAGRAPREAEERRRRQGEAVPPLMELTTNISAAVREVMLVTYDIDRRALVLRTRAPSQ